MKTIASLSGPEFLRACNRVRHAAAAFLSTTGVLELRKILPEIPEDATPEQKDALLTAQGKKNLGLMLDRMLEEEPEATYELLRALVIPDKPGQELDGLDLLSAGLELICSPKVVDFFTRLVELAPMIMGG